MRYYSLKSSLLLSAVVLIVVVLFFNLVYIFFCLNRSEIADLQAVLGKRILFCAVSGPGAEKSAKRELLTDTSKEFDACDKGVLLEIELLLNGGAFAGRDLSRIKALEVVELLESMRANQQNLLQSPTTDASGPLTFYHQARALNAALTFRALGLKASLWPPFWLALALVMSLLICLWVRSIFVLKERSIEANYPVRSLADFENQLLLALPVAFILLDEFLSIKFVNRLGETYFGQFSASGKPGFSEYCRDQTLLGQLSHSFLKAQSTPYRMLSVESDDVLLYLKSGRKYRVTIQWYKLYLGDRYYLLGVIRDLKGNHLKELSSKFGQEHFKDLSRNLFRVQDDERKHLADELHDGLCQSLAALKMQVYRVEKGIDNQENRGDCRKARQFIAQIIEDVRRLSHDLSPVILDDLGLSGALAHLVNNFAALNDLKISVILPDLEGCFSNDTARNIYRIIQEALNNIAKHAQASLLILEAEIMDDKVHFRVQDNGVGLDSNPAAPGGRIKAGLGLASMAQRVQLLDGEFSISANPGTGCEVSFTLPKK